MKFPGFSFFLRNSRPFPVTWFDGVGDGGVLAEVGVDAPRAANDRPGRQLLAHAHHVAGRVHQDGLVVVHVQDADADPHPRRARRRPAVAGLADKLVLSTGFPIKHLSRCQHTCNITDLEITNSRPIEPITAQSIRSEI